MDMRWVHSHPEPGKGEPEESEARRNLRRLLVADVKGFVSQMIGLEKQWLTEQRVGKGVGRTDALSGAGERPIEDAGQRRVGELLERLIAEGGE